MPKYAQFNPNDDPPQHVIGWYDTDEFDYPMLPDDSELLPITDDDWAAHMDDPSGWAVQDTLLVPWAPPEPPPPSTQDQALILLLGPVTVQCDFFPDLNADYAIDSQTTNQINSIAASISGGLGLPGGGQVFNWPDAYGIPHQWPATQFINYAREVMNFLYNCGQAAQGYTPDLPSPILIIA